MYRFLKLTSTLLMVVVFFLTTLAKAETEPEQTVEMPKTEVQLVEEWAFNFMVKKAPPGRKVYYEEAIETKEEGEARYRSIASDVVRVVFDPQTKVPFTGPRARTQTAAVILGIMFHESSFMKHVDYGLGKYGRGDNGRSWCLMQMNVGEGRSIKWNEVHDRKVRWNDPEEEIFLGYTGQEMVDNRRLCIQEGLKILRLSFNACSHLDITLRLASYASGTCDKGHDKSLARMGTALKWVHESQDQRKQFSDKNVSQAVADLIQKEEEDRLRKLEERHEPPSRQQVVLEDAS